MKAVHFDRDGNGVSPRCGNRDWVQLSAEADSVTCRTCLNLMAGTHGTGNRRYDVMPCGTEAAARRHRRRGEKVHESDRRAANRAAADRKARRARERKVLAS